MSIVIDYTVTQFTTDRIVLQRDEGGEIGGLAHVVLRNADGASVGSHTVALVLSQGEQQAILDFLGNHLNDFATEEDITWST